jgi:hypothetical protein
MQSIRSKICPLQCFGTLAPGSVAKVFPLALLLWPLAGPLAEAGAPVASGMQIAAPSFVETVQRRGVAVRGGVAVGPRGGAVARGGYAVRGPRGGVAVGRGVAVARPVPGRAWVRPSSYWWRPGTAIAAGAAIGFVTAAAATAYVNSQPPAPGSCWYYTDQQRTQGFWDACPK